MTTILYAHPYGGSFNHAILSEIERKLTSENKEYEVLDLYADGFNPALEAASLRLYSRGETARNMSGHCSKPMNSSWFSQCGGE